MTSGFQGYFIQAIKLTARGDVSASPDIVWQQKKGTPYVTSPVLSGDRIFVTKGTESYLSCLNALTGEFHFSDQQLEGMRGGVYASPSRPTASSTSSAARASYSYSRTQRSSKSSQRIS